MVPDVWIADFDSELGQTAFGIKSKIPWVFEYFIPTANRGIWPRLGRLMASLARGGRPARLRRGGAMLVALLLFAASEFEIRRVLKRALDSAPAMLFLPGADQYSLAALARLLGADSRYAGQSIHIRLMGVMEHESHLRVTRAAYLGYLRQIIASSAKVTISCETEKYAARVAASLHVPIAVTHIPGGPVAPLTAAMPDRYAPAAGLVLVCVGGARRDKGYFELAELATSLRLAGSLPMTLRVQRMVPGNPEFDPDYDVLLMRCPNVEFLPAFMSDEQLSATLQSADAILLPYDGPTYEFRGSAILFDSLPHGRPILARRGTAFGDTVDSQGFGFTFESPDELNLAALWIHGLSAAELAALGQRQRRYLSRMEANLKGALTHET